MSISLRPSTAETVKRELLNRVTARYHELSNARAEFNSADARLRVVAATGDVRYLQRAAQELSDASGAMLAALYEFNTASQYAVSGGSTWNEVGRAIGSAAANHSTAKRFEETVRALFAPKGSK